MLGKGYWILLQKVGPLFQKCGPTFIENWIHIFGKTLVLVDRPSFKSQQ